MSGDVHVRFYEGPGVKLPGATHPADLRHSSLIISGNVSRIRLVLDYKR